MTPNIPSFYAGYWGVKEVLARKITKHCPGGSAAMEHCSLGR